MGLSTSILRSSLPYHLSPSLTQTSLILPHPGSVHSSCSSSYTRPRHSFSVPIPQCPLTADFRSASGSWPSTLAHVRSLPSCPARRLRGLSEARILGTHPPWLPRVSHPLLQRLKHGTDQPAHFGGTHVPSSLESMIPCLPHLLTPPRNVLLSVCNLKTLHQLLQLQKGPSSCPSDSIYPLMPGRSTLNLLGTNWVFQVCTNVSQSAQEFKV